MNSSHRTCNILLLGSRRVGKTRLRKIFTGEQTFANCRRTLNLEVSNIFVHGKNVNVYEATTTFHYNPESNYDTMHAFMIVFDLSNEKSFRDVSKWANSIRKHPENKQKPIIIVGAQWWNKQDVSWEDVQDLSEIYGIEAVKVSSNKAVYKVFYDLIRRVDGRISKKRKQSLLNILLGCFY